MRREVVEETCLEVSVKRLLFVVESVGSRNTNLIGGKHVPWNEVRFFFQVTPKDGSVAKLPEVPDEDETGVVWLPLEELPRAPVLPQVVLEVLAALKEPTGRPLVIPNSH